MRVIEKTIYQFDELTDAAKEKAREWFRGIAEYVIDDAKRIGALIGFEVDEIYWRGFWSQGDGACWSGSVTYHRGRASDVARECPQDAEIQRQNSCQIRGRVSANDRDEDDANQIVSDFADWIYRQLEQEYEYQMSDECVDETIRANDYEFYEDGEPA